MGLFSIAADHMKSQHTQRQAAATQWIGDRYIKQHVFAFVAINTSIFA